jgi:hypothetical protein
MKVAHVGGKPGNGFIGNEKLLLIYQLPQNNGISPDVAASSLWGKWGWLIRLRAYRGIVWSVGRQIAKKESFL